MTLPSALHRIRHTSVRLAEFGFYRLSALVAELSAVSSFVVGMVDQIGSFSADIIKPPMSFETATEKTALSDNQPLYHGMEGLQTAVLRFLGNVIERKEKDLYLYSDQNIDWITTDKSFQQKWMSLMI